ncbi:MAG: Ig-like domain-containing protein, partial [Reichenbachiella sp.]
MKTNKQFLTFLAILLLGGMAYGQAPVITSTYPSTGAIGVSNQTTIRIDFDQTISVNTGYTIAIRELKENLGSDPWFHSGNFLSPAVTVGSNYIHIDVSQVGKTFDYDTEYYIYIFPGAVEDVTGTYSHPGIDDKTTLTFRISEDPAAPHIVSLNPSDNAIDAPVNGVFTATFDEPITKGSGNAFLLDLTNDLFANISADKLVFSGNTLTIDLGTAAAYMDNNTTYYIKWDEGFIESVATGYPVAEYSTHRWRFTTGAPDGVAPTITGSSPIHSATNVSKDLSTITLTYSEDLVDSPHGWFYLYKGGTPYQLTNTIDGNIVTLSNIPELEYNTYYSVRYSDPNGIHPRIRDYTGTELDGGWVSVGFTTEIDPDADVTAPTLLSTSPAHLETDVALDANLVLTFDEDVVANTGSFTLTLLDGTPVETFPVSSANVQIVDNVVTINPTSDLIYSLVYKFGGPANILQDASGNGVALINATLHRFYTEADPAANTAPTDITLNSSSIDENSAVNTVVGTLSTTDANAGDSHTYTLVSGTGSTNNASFNINDSQLRASSSFDFESKSSYSIRVQTSDGTATYQKQFTITVNDVAEDDTAPSVLSTSPADNATDVSVDLGTFTFNMSEAIKVGDDPGISGTDHYIELKKGTRPNTITLIKRFDVSSADVEITGSTVLLKNIPQLEHNTAYWVRYYSPTKAAITDLSGNPMTNYNSSNGFAFTTEEETLDTAAPTVVSTSPADETTGVSINPTLTITFDESIATPTGFQGWVYLRNPNGSVFETINIEPASITAGTLTISGNQVELNPASTLAYNTSYYVTTNGGFRDAAGNQSATQQTNTWWNFTTETAPDEAAPVIQSYSPADGATTVATDANLVMTFDENVSTYNGTLTIYNDSDEEIESFGYGQTALGITDNVVTINPTSDLAESTDFYVLYTANFIKDASNNFIPALTDKTVWNFSTAAGPDETAPALVSISPADGATDVALNSNIVITFDEPVFQNGDPGVKANLYNYTDASAAPLAESFATISGWGTTTLTIEYISFSYQPNEEYGLWTYSDFITDEAGNGYNFDQNSHQFTTGSAPNNAPTNIALNSSNIDENNAVNAVVGTLSTTDADAGDSHTYSLVSGTGSTDNNSFNINGSELRASSSFDFESKSSYGIRVQTNDGTATYQKQFTITVNDVDDTAPTIVSTEPEDNALDVAADIGTLTLEISEPVQIVSSPGVAGTDYFLQLRRVIDENSSYVVKEFDVSAGDVEIDGSTIMVKNVPQLSYTSEYFWKFSGTRIFEDALGNKLSAFEYYFTTGENPNDVTSPVLLSVSPAPNSTNAPIDGNFVFTFDENIQYVSGGTGQIEIASGGMLLELIDLGDPQVSINQNVLTVDPKKLMRIDTDYRISIGLGFIEDLAGNHFFNYQYSADQFTTASTFTFGTSKSPEDNASSVSIDIGTFSVTFDTDIQKSGNGIYEVQLKRVSDNQIAKSWQISSEEVVVDGPTVTFNNVPELEPNTSYWIHKQHIESFTDLNDNEIWHPTYINTHWNFTTGAAPNSTPADITLSSSSITENNATNAIIGTLSTTDTDEGDTHTYSLVSGTGSTDNASFNINGNQLRASIGFDFENKESYSIRLQTNDGTATYQKQFTITVIDEDDTAPVLVSTIPAIGATDVAVNSHLVVTFSEAITAVSSSPSYIRLVDFDTDIAVESFDPENNSDGRVTISGATITINPTNDLDYSKQYYLIFNDDMLQDEVGNLFEGYNNNSTWNFTTEEEPDLTPPTVVSFDPLHNATEVPVDGDLVVTFSEEIQETGSYIRVKKVIGSSAVLSGRLESYPELFTVSGNQLTIHLANANLSALSYGISYYVQMNEGAVQDLAGNAFAGIADDASTWSFTTEKRDQIITISDIADKLITDAAFDVVANTDSELPLTYDVSGPATISGSTITLTGGTGLVTVTVSQAGDANHYSASEQITFNVTDPSKLTQTITFSVDDQVYGDVVTLDGSTDSGLPVSYELVSGPATRSDNQLTIIGIGVVVVRATADGDDSYNPAVPVEVSFDAAKADLTVTAHNQTMTYGEELPSLTFEYDGFVNEEDLTTLEEEPTISTVEATSDAGIYDITLTGGSADNYELILVNGELTIEKADPVLEIAEVDDLAIDAEPFSLEVTIDSDQNLNYSAFGPATVSTEGLVTLDGEIGEVTITVVAEVSTNYNEASESVTFSVFDNSPLAQTITITAIEDKLTTDEAFEVTASSTSELEVALTVTGPASIDGTTITLDGTAGTVTVFANQSGNEEYAAAEEESITFEVTEPAVEKQDQTITIADIADKLTTDDAFEVEASSTSELEVTLTVTGPAT